MSGTNHQLQLLVVIYLRENRVLDCAADAERKRQLAVDEFAPGETAEDVSEESLVRGDLRDATIVEQVRAGNADAA